MIGLLFCGLFLFVFVVFPLFAAPANGFLDQADGLVHA